MTEPISTHDCPFEDVVEHLVRTMAQAERWAGHNSRNVKDYDDHLRTIVNVIFDGIFATTLMAEAATRLRIKLMNVRVCTENLVGTLKSVERERQNLYKATSNAGFRLESGTH